MKADTGAVDVLGGIMVGTKRAPGGEPIGNSCQESKGYEKA